MTIKHPRVNGVVCFLTSLVILYGLAAAPANVSAQSRPDSLELRKPENVRVTREYDRSLNRFVVFINWDDAPDSMATFIHRPDTTGWAAGTPSDSIAFPLSRGVYWGDTDRTVNFRAGLGGTVGQDSIPIRFSIKNEEYLNGLLNVGSPYTPGTWIPVIFTTQDRDTVHFGLEVSFPNGIVDKNAEFKVGMEDYEGFHIWRGLDPMGSDLEIVGEISKEEAFRIGGPGGSELDFMYLYIIIPALRDLGVFYSEFSMDCLEYSIEMDLEYNEFMWFDCSAINGETYYYLVTNFDRGYNVRNSTQGLVKFDRCQPDWGVPLSEACRSELVSIDIEVDATSSLSQVYAVPNPFRTGGSRLITENYANYSDDKCRFVNVPEFCEIRIFTVSGDLVWKTNHNGSDGNIEWDGRNQSGEEVASGVYIYKIEDASGNHVYGRLIIIH